MNQKKTLILYFSVDGNTKFIAENVKEEFGGDLFPIKLKKDFKHTGLMKYFWGGKQVFFKEKPELDKPDYNLEEYDFIIFGTPVWNFSLTPPMRSLLHSTSFEGKKVAFYCCYDGRPGKTFEDMKALLKGATIVGTHGFKAPLRADADQVKKEIVDWCHELKSEKA